MKYINELSKSQINALNKDIALLKATRLYEIIVLSEKYHINPTELFELVQYTEKKTVEKHPLDECRNDYAKSANKIFSYALRIIGKKGERDDGI